MADPVNLRSALRLRNSFAFPLQTAEGRREVAWGAVLLVALPGVGWLLNMGHRIAFVRQMQRGVAPFPAFSDPARPWYAVYRELMWDGFVTFLGMVYYHAPGAVLLAAGALLRSAPLTTAGAVILLTATALVPGYMTHFCAHRNALEILNPLLALRRVREGGRAYWHAWLIVLAALAVSFVGLLAFGVGFFVTSVWFWQVAGFSFATVFSQRFDLVAGHTAA